MLDVNLGNKTLVIGVLIALILSYGMVNFDSDSSAHQKGTAIRTAFQSTDHGPEDVASASDASEGISGEILDESATDAVDQPVAESTDDESTMSVRERRQLDLL